ncbi:MAG: cation-translocating P-type ATPase [Burkholderiales bacterium]|nr:cation-translocating P-type ATPase [Burkholderiales bacterium]
MAVDLSPMGDAYLRSAGEVAASLNTNPRVGLTDAEAAARLARYGANVLASAPPVPTWRKLLAQFESPLVILLLVAGAISLAVWAIEREHDLPYESLTILAIVVANALLGFFQEARAEEAVASLRKMTAAQATVVRGGARAVVPAADLVPGDIVVLEEGATVPADARLVESVSLQTAEAALTGESMPVAKDTAPVAADAAIGDRSNMVFAGTAVTYGHGVAVVTATGMQAEVGKIAGLLRETASEQTPLQAQLDSVGKILGIVVIAIAVIVGATILVIQRDFSTAALVGILLYTVSLAVSAVPEGLAAVTTVVLSLGMQRMAKRNAVIRRLAAVETLGSATVICTDKTGTLTKNEMTVRVLVTAAGRIDFTGSGYAPRGELLADGQALGEGARRVESERALATGLLVNNAQVVERDGRWAVMGDPTEGALKVAALKAGIDPAALAQQLPRVGEVPFSSERKLMSTAHADAAGGGRMLLLCKGAPDVLLARCTSEQAGDGARPLTEARREDIRAGIDALAGEALRTIGLASREIASGAGAVREQDEQDFTWLGVVGMIDPPREEARPAVATAHDAGIRVVMITGDHPNAALAIARELGIAPADRHAAQSADEVVIGARLEKMADAELAEVAARTNVYARVSSEHKLRIVRALQSRGAIVAMTGDGVNDAPALKAADIGIAMGITGTDVSKEAADMILADDNFATIVAAIEEGRSIYANIQKFLRYLLSTNLGEVLVMFFGVVLASVIGLVAGDGEALILPLLATMILWINLVTDGLPALAVGVDPAEPALMRRAPRDPGTGVITRRMWWGIGVASVVMGIGTLLVLDAGLPGGLIEGSGDVRYARTMAFHVLVLYQLFDVYCIRSDEASLARGLFRNRWLWLSVAAALLLQLAVLYVPALQKAFGTVPLDAYDWFVCVAVASTVVYARELLKWYWRRVDRRAAIRGAHVG